jgi:hypothetical protein
VTNRGLATGVFRAWGVMWWFYAAFAVPRIAAMLAMKPFRSQADGMQWFAVGFEIISLLCTIAIAWFLVARAEWLARIVFPLEQETGLSVGAPELRTVLFAAIGLYFFLDGIQGLAGSGYQLLTKPRGDDPNSFTYLWRRSGETFVQSLIGTFAGALILFRPRGLAGLYESVFGLREARKEEP